MSEKTRLEIAEKFVKDRVAGYDGGHDWWHIMRVRRLARFINETENTEDPFLVDIAALFHDFADSKFAGNTQEESFELVSRFLNDNGMDDYNNKVINTMRYVSFSSREKAGGIRDGLLYIIQDADRLDAIGAIGIARAFNYGGYRNNIIYSPIEDENRNSTINHFYEKLLLLSSMMNTETGKKLALERHRFLELFLNQFHHEWNSDTF
jgi:uncharacterized protein